MIKSIQISVLLLLGSIYHILAQNGTPALQSSTVTIKITGVSSDKGAVYFAMYTDIENWLETSKYEGKTLTVNGSAVVTFDDIPNGHYAISVYHDENDNGELDTNFMGIPKEDFACSNGAKGKFGPPKWKDAVFEVVGNDLTKTIKF